MMRPFSTPHNMKLVKIFLSNRLQSLGMNIDRVMRDSPKASRFIWIFLMFYTSGSFFVGCATIDQTTYLQELSTTTPVNAPPLLLNADSSEGYFHIIPRVSYSTENALTGQIEGSGPYRTSGRNLEWRIPSTDVSIDVDWRVSSRIAVTGGLRVGKSDEEWLYGVGLGMGWLIGGGHIGGRLDWGLQLYTVSYQASSVVVTEGTSIFGSWTDVSYYVDDGRSSALRTYASVMFNTLFPNSPVNGFVQLALGSQQLADFGPERQYVLGVFVYGTKTDARVQSSSLFLMCSPGFYFNLTPSLRLIGGVRLVLVPDIDDPDPGGLVLPVIQCEVSL